MSLLAVALAASISGSVQDRRPCPPVCSTTINLQIVPTAQQRGQPGRYFLAAFPVEGGQPNMAVGGYWTGSGWQVSAHPASFRQASLSAVQDRISIQHGLCALAAESGVSGEFAILAGYGVDVLKLASDEAETSAGDLSGDSPYAVEMRDALAKFQGMQSPQLSDFAAARAMREDGSLSEIGRVRCE